MQRERLGSRLGFILLSAGCAIGLGNVYRFPIWTGAYGGAFFVLIYLAFLLLLGLPVMVAEFAVGRASQRSIATSFEALERKGQKWHWMKYLGIGANYMLMMFYTTITGWFCIYFIKYLNGSILSVPASDLGATFGATVTDLPLNLIVTAVVLLLGFGVCALGLNKGVERVTKVMMVALFLLMIGLAIYSFTLPGLGTGLKFYLMPSAERLTSSGVWTVISAAMSQAFFTLSLGIGSMAIFGSYIGKERSLLGESVTIIGLDTLVALMAGLIIFPAYFTFNPGVTEVAASEAGAGFLFITLSNIFGSMGPVVGRIVGTLFFLFMLFAAMSTVIAVFENIMSFWLEKTNLKRWQIALINLGLLFVLCLPFIFCNCFESWGNFKVFLGKNFGDFEDFLVSNLALPIGSLVYVLFCTWKFGWGWDNFYAEVNAGKGAKVPAWIRPYMKFVLPLIILVVLVVSIVTAL
ncbi:MAG: sodium-dependent transporter [Clostridia bacterium]|nr:sodium-dependent transporter [Clostridia bacterium]